MEGKNKKDSPKDHKKLEAWNLRRMAGAQALRPSSIAFPEALARSWIGGGAAGNSKWCPHEMAAPQTVPQHMAQQPILCGLRNMFVFTTKITKTTLWFPFLHLAPEFCV